MMRRPPYYNRARARLASVSTPAHGQLIVHVGNGAWGACRDDPRAAVMLPPDQWPEGFDWGIAALSVPPVLLMGWDASDEVLARTARTLIRDGAIRVLILPGKAPSVLFSEVAHAA